MSQERPTIAPSISAARPMCVPESITLCVVLRVLAQGHAGGQHGVRADGRLGGDPAVVADERRPLTALEVVEVDALADPHVPAQADPGNVEPHALVERVEVRLPVLVEVADVLPVAVEDVAVERPAHLEQQREELLREVVGPVVRMCASTSGSST